MSRREQIRMSPDEVAAFLEQERTLTCATLGPRGWPHLMPLWYVMRARQTTDRDVSAAATDALEVELWSWTYAASQKARNLQRDARASIQVEAGETYDQLRGVMLECDVIVHRAFDVVHALGRDVFARYTVQRGSEPAPQLHPRVEAMVASQAVKRVGLQFVERRRTSWDHRKLGGVY